MRSRPGPARVAVLASGGGTNLQALIDHFHPRPAARARVELVVASRPGIGALDRAAAAGVPALTLNARDLGPERFTHELLDAFAAQRIDLVVLAGYLQLLPPAVVERFAGRILNIHPALLPAFGGAGMYGARVHEAVLQSGTRVSGATVHLVNERYDEGQIVAQWPVPVLAGDTPATLAARVLRVEHLLLPAALEALCADPGRPGAAATDPVAFDLVAAAAPTPDALRRITDDRREIALH
jgi:formyltetrahydrofolate-dependent phosphoribosylglycinamide formyltransferase